MTIINHELQCITSLSYTNFLRFSFIDLAGSDMRISLFLRFSFIDLAGSDM